MATYEYRPKNNLGPISFGLTRDEVKRVLGAPKETLTFGDDGPSDGILAKIISDTGQEDLNADLAQAFQGQETDIYNEGEDDAEDKAEAAFSEITYVNGTVSKIGSLDQLGTLEFDGLDLTGDDLLGIVRALFDKSPTALMESSFIYFPDLGVIISDDEDAQRYVAFTDGRTEQAMIDDESYEPIDREEFEEFHEDEEED